MAKDDKHRDHRTDNADLIANSMKAEQKDKERQHSRNLNKLWLWLGVLILVAILLWWIFSIGFVEDTSGMTNFGT